MSKGQSKKSTDRRKKPRRSRAKKSVSSEKKIAGSSPREAQQELCQNCSKDLSRADRALFVEEEVGRIFCSESCITAYFTPEIERLEKEFFEYLSRSDFPVEEREKLAHLRWVTLQEPDEIWREKTLAGDYRYTLISEFQPGNKPLWFVCICLFLRGEPSFLYLAFPTKNQAMASHYRRGERVEWPRETQAQLQAPGNMSVATTSPGSSGAGRFIDGLAEDWTADEAMRAELGQRRKNDDIPAEEFGLYQACLDETLEAPDEIWSIELGGNEEGRRIYHFLRYYEGETPPFWLVVVARETEDNEQIEILDAFPTRDRELVDRYRKGEQEVSNKDVFNTTRLVH